MRFMAGQTVLICHFCSVWVVTFEAVQELTMLEVAPLAVKFTVLTRIVSQLSSFSGMAGDTDRFDRRYV